MSSNVRTCVSSQTVCSSKCIINIGYVLQEEKITFDIYKSALNSNCVVQPTITLRPSMDERNNIKITVNKGTQTKKKYLFAETEDSAVSTIKTSSLDGTNKTSEKPTSDRPRSRYERRENYPINKYRYLDPTPVSIKKNTTNFCDLFFDGTKSHRRHKPLKQSKKKRALLEGISNDLTTPKDDTTDPDILRDQRKKSKHKKSVKWQGLPSQDVAVQTMEVDKDFGEFRTMLMNNSEQVLIGDANKPVLFKQRNNVDDISKLRKLKVSVLPSIEIRNKGEYADALQTGFESTGTTPSRPMMSRRRIYEDESFDNISFTEMKRYNQFAKSRPQIPRRIVLDRQQIGSDNSGKCAQIPNLLKQASEYRNDNLEEYLKYIRQLCDSISELLGPKAVAEPAPVDEPPKEKEDVPADEPPKETKTEEASTKESLTSETEDKKQKVDKLDPFNLFLKKDQSNVKHPNWVNKGRVDLSRLQIKHNLDKSVTIAENKKSHNLSIETKSLSIPEKVNQIKASPSKCFLNNIKSQLNVAIHTERFFKGLTHIGKYKTNIPVNQNRLKLKGNEPKQIVPSPQATGKLRRLTTFVQNGVEIVPAQEKTITIQNKLVTSIIKKKPDSEADSKSPNASSVTFNSQVDVISNDNARSVYMDAMSMKNTVVSLTATNTILKRSRTFPTKREFYTDSFIPYPHYKPLKSAPSGTKSSRSEMFSVTSAGFKDNKVEKPVLNSTFLFTKVDNNKIYDSSFQKRKDYYTNLKMKMKKKNEYENSSDLRTYNYTNNGLKFLKIPVEMKSQTNFINPVPARQSKNTSNFLQSIEGIATTNNTEQTKCDTMPTKELIEIYTISKSKTTLSLWSPRRDTPKKSLKPIETPKITAKQKNFPTVHSASDMFSLWSSPRSERKTLTKSTNKSVRRKKIGYLKKKNEVKTSYNNKRMCKNDKSPNEPLQDLNAINCTFCCKPELNSFYTVKFKPQDHNQSLDKSNLKFPSKPDQTTDFNTLKSKSKPDKTSDINNIKIIPTPDQTTDINKQKTKSKPDEITDVNNLKLKPDQTTSINNTSKPVKIDTEKVENLSPENVTLPVLFSCADESNPKQTGFIIFSPRVTNPPILSYNSLESEFEQVKSNNSSQLINNSDYLTTSKVNPDTDNSYDTDFSLTCTESADNISPKKVHRKFSLRSISSNIHQFFRKNGSELKKIVPCKKELLTK